MSKQMVATLLAVPVCAALLALRLGMSRKQEPVTEELICGPLAVWTEHEGVVDAVNVCSIASQLDGPATIVELVPDGSRVATGDTVVRFEATQWEREVVRFERELTLAKADLDTLLNARIPLELRDLETRLVEARRNLEEESALLEADRELLRDELVAERDVRQQELRVAAALSRVESLEKQLELTRAHLHPAAVERARANVAAAERELAFARRQLANCTICAPLEGVIVFKPIAVGGEFRTVRVGDTVFRNQIFIVIPETTNLIIRCEVPEADLGRVREGCDAVIFPVAQPGTALKGTVQSVGSMARSLPGWPETQKYFGVVVRLCDSSPFLRCGMTVRMRICSYFNPAAILIPRVAVVWHGTNAFCQVMEAGRTRSIPLQTGWGNETHFEVLRGPAPGQRVVVP